MMSLQTFLAPVGARPLRGRVVLWLVVAAVAVGYANFMGHGSGFTGVELTIHDIETYLGILIGAVTLGMALFWLPRLGITAGGIGWLVGNGLVVLFGVLELLERRAAVLDGQELGRSGACHGPGNQGLAGAWWTEQQDAFAGPNSDPSEDLLAQLQCGVNVLQSTQNARNVITGLGIELNGRDVLLAEFQLGIDDLTHGVSNDEVY